MMLSCVLVMTHQYILSFLCLLTDHQIAEQYKMLSTYGEFKLCLHEIILIYNIYTLYPLKLALASLTGVDRSIGIVRLRTKTTEFFLMII
jgi:hypothetical protein